MSNIKLYSARACPFAHRSRLVLAEKSVAFELVEIDLANKPAWYGSVSLYGKVPALEHAGLRVVESAVINEYIDESFPEPALLPASLGLRALARIWIDFANTRLAPAFGRILRGATEAERDTGKAELGAALLLLEREALSKLSGGGPYWFGQDPSLVDFTFYPWFERLAALEQHSGFKAPASTPYLARWREAVSARESVRAIANPVEFYLERYRGYGPAPEAVTGAREPQKVVRSERNGEATRAR